MSKIAGAVVLAEADRTQLGRWIRAQFTTQQVVLRSRILLMAGEGKQDLEIADELDVNRHTPALWRKRFQTQGLEGIWEIQSGRGRKPLYDEKKVAAIVEATLQTKPKGSTHWSCRMSAVAQSDPSGSKWNGFKMTHLEGGLWGCKFSGAAEDVRPLWQTNSRCKSKKQYQI